MRQLSLDTILSASNYFVRKWSPGLERNQSRDVLRFLLCRLYDQGRGKLVGAQVTLAQGTLGRKLGLSRQWTGTLLSRLSEAGWIEYAAPWIGPGMRGATIVRAGRHLKRLLIMLTKSRPKNLAIIGANDRRQSFPFLKERKILSILAKEKLELRPEVVKRLPLLLKWVARGEG